MRLAAVAAVLLFGACAQVEVVRLPSSDTLQAAIDNCRDAAKKTRGDQFAAEGFCLLMIPGARTNTITYQPGTITPVPAGCHLLATTAAKGHSREIYSCTQ